MKRFLIVLLLLPLVTAGCIYGPARGYDGHEWNGRGHNDYHDDRGQHGDFHGDRGQYQDRGPARD